MLDVGPVAAEARHDRFARFRVQAHLARQREKRESLAKFEALRVGAFGDRSAFGLLLAILLAELNIRTEAAGAEAHVEPGLGIGAEHFRFGESRLLAVGVGELPGKAAVGVIGAADESAELADLEAQAPNGARRTGPGIGALPLVGED